MLPPDIIPALMPESLSEFQRLARVVGVFTHTAQLDVMDGKFVPSVSWPFHEDEMDELRAMSRLPESDLIAYEVHLMVENPERIGMIFAEKGARTLIGHVETMGHTNEVLASIEAWKSGGVRVGISLLLDTPLSEVAPLVSHIDFIQVMSIGTIGYQGHVFDDRALDRIREIRAQYPHLRISVDGGVSGANASALAEVGANQLCVGSGIVKAADPGKAYRDILAAL